MVQARLLSQRSYYFFQGTSHPKIPQYGALVGGWIYFPFSSSIGSMFNKTLLTTSLTCANNIDISPCVLLQICHHSGQSHSTMLWTLTT